MRFTIVFAAVVAAVVLAAAPATAQTSRPKAVTGSATDVTQTTATLNGVVNPNGKGTIWYFDYGPTTRFGERTAESQEIFGTTDSPARFELKDLDPGTTYRYRLVAYNGHGTTYGAVGTFQTVANPYALPVRNQVSLSAKPARVTNGFETSISGQVTGPDNAGVKVTLFADPYLFESYRSTGETATTDAQGRFSFKLFPDVRTRYRVVADTIPAIKSDFVEVAVRYRIALKAPRVAAAGSRVRLTGSVSPDHDDELVYLERRFGKKGRFKTIAKTKLRKAVPGRSNFRFSVKVSRTAQYRVRMPDDIGHLRTRSRAKTIRAA